MKKVILLLSLFIFIHSVAYTRQYFFYYYKEKLTLNANLQYFAVKFKANTSTGVKSNIIIELFGDKIEKADDFSQTFSNGQVEDFKVVKLKRAVSDNEFSNIKQKLVNYGQIEYVSSGFSKNDKVVHFQTGEVIVKFRDNVSDFNIQNLNTLFQTHTIEKARLFNNVYVLRINSRGEGDSEDAFDISSKYSLTPFVQFAQPNFIRIGLLQQVIPNDSLLPLMWNIKNTGQVLPGGVQGIPGCDINGDSAWLITDGNPRILMGIIDTGTDTNHVDLRGNLCDRKLWYNALDENQDPTDRHSHGTAICGIAAAVGNNLVGMAGVAWNCKILPVRVFSGSAYTTDYILGKGLNWAWMHGADVLNNSWGGGIPSPLISHAILNAITYGRNGKGTVVFASSGNDDTSEVIYPSSMTEVISVGGISPCNQRKSRTSCDGQNDWGANYGDNLSVVAPTPFIACTQSPNSWCSYCCNGTSSTCPQVSAIGALILAKNINLSADSVRIIIERSARKVGNYTYNINKPNGLWNNEMGYGRADAKHALDLTPPGPGVIYDQVPPIINFIVPQSQRFNSQIVLTATITDNEAVANGPNSPRLYYFTSSDPATKILMGISGSNNSYSFTIPAADYGTRIYYYFAAQDTSSNNNVITYPLGGGGVNPPGTFRPVKQLFLQNTDSYDTLVYSTDVPINFSAVRETTVVSLLNVPISKTILGVNCLININHQFDEDLSVSLISPQHTEIVLTGGIGGSGSNYIDTYFNDYAASPISDTNNHPPYTGIFRPIERLWLLNGENSNGTWYLKIVDNNTNEGGVLNSWSIRLKYSTFTDQQSIPAKFSLVENYPNPFNPVTRILFNVSYRAKVRIAVYDILGRLVRVLLDDFRSPRYNDYIDFNTLDKNTNNGNGIASGVYFYTMLVNGDFVESRKMVLIK